MEAQRYYLRIKKQSILKKFITFILFGILVNPIFAQEDRLKLGDELFQEGQYVQAFEMYDELMNQKNVASPAMLMKMAYIKEGLGQIPEALFYLNMYYLSTSDRKTLDKMEELAEEHDLSGYGAGDLEYFISYYYRFYTEIVLIIAALAFFSFAVLIYRKRKGHQKPVLAGVFLMLFLGLLFFQVNYARDYDKGIIKEQRAYLMSGPSAASKVKEVVKPGHRVKILGYEDVWARIDWRGETAYVKTQHLKNISFL